MASDNLYCKIIAKGLVQGVGFRPTVAESAEDAGVLGYVKNLGGEVEIIAFGASGAMERFLFDLKHIAVGRVDSYEIEELEHIGVREEVVILCDKSGTEYALPLDKFHIEESKSASQRKRFLPVDLPTCEICEKQLLYPGNRRYRYPFISCTQCGPRFSIQRNVPYDRESITMDAFEMCPECAHEYTRKFDIRRHAQTIACHNCGPQLKLLTFDKKDNSLHAKEHDTEGILAEAVAAIEEGKIVAIKDIGGFHFAFSPYMSKPAKRLREFKNRDQKPFAVMFPSKYEICELCNVAWEEQELLLSDARPIVLLGRRKKNEFAPEVCGNSDRIGAMLPCNPLQILLLEKCGPLVMTSGNRGGEPIIISDEEMIELMKQGCPDMILTNDREILTPLDDSIYQVSGSHTQIIRRARGLVPEPIEIKKTFPKDAFAAGGDLKAVFALGRDNLVYLSQHFGDLEDVNCTKSRGKAIARMEELLDIHPEISAGDLHPSYISTQGTEKKIQHHHAHFASVIAEHGLEGKVLGIVCDGTGYGTDGTIWGSEFFVSKKKEMYRVGHFSTVKLLGADASAKDADMTLLSYMLSAREQGFNVSAFFEELEQSQDAQKIKMQEMAWEQNINTAYSSSMGRLFDAAAAVLEICHYNSYEGECAIRLEQEAHMGTTALLDYPHLEWLDSLGISIKHEEHMRIVDSVSMIAELYALKKQLQNLGVESWKKILAYIFHHSIALAMEDVAEKICKDFDIKQIALSGGCFLNRLLLEEVSESMVLSDYDIYTNEKVPCGDGGIALGQMYLL